MAKEIERKYLVVSDAFIAESKSRTHIRQTYISDDPDATVRIRLRDDQAYLTVKGRNRGAVREEWEYPIPAADAVEMAETLCGGFAIDKTRYIVDHGGLTWEVDIFHGRHAGLVLAEVELPSEDTLVALPPWIGEDVTGVARYYNSTLAQH